jgi:hypothetical protein
MVFYYAVATLGGNEMGARTEIQLGSILFVMIVGKLLFDIF